MCEAVRDKSVQPSSVVDVQIMKDDSKVKTIDFYEEININQVIFYLCHKRSLQTSFMC